MTACKTRSGGAAIPGWGASLTEAGVVVDSQVTGANGCYTWTGLTPGISYDVHEEERAGWLVVIGPDHVWPASAASSNASLSFTFVNDPLEGCTPGFWQGGNDFGTAGGKWLWNDPGDPDWAGAHAQPFYWDTQFGSVFSGSSETMWHFVNPDMWEVNDDFHKAARSIVAAYLNASWGIGYAYTTGQLLLMWTDAVTSGGDWDLASLHSELDAADNAYYREGDPPRCPISASIPG